MQVKTKLNKFERFLFIVNYLKGTNSFFLPIMQVDNTDRSAFSKLLESIKTNYNDRFDEIRKNWGGAILGSKSAARISKLERAKAKEIKAVL